jgi:hypothetical protein
LERETITRMNEKKAIRSFLGDRPDSGQWREWRKTLEERLKHLLAERDAAAPEKQHGFDARAAELRRQIVALEQEEMVTEFIEDSVRVTLAMGSVVDGEQEDPD